MKKYIKVVIPVIFILLAIFLITWRLWPHTFSDIIPTDENAITSLSCTATISGV